MYSLFHVPLRKEKIGDLDIFRRPENAKVYGPPLFGLDEAAPASPVFIRINDDRHTLAIWLKTLLFFLPPIILVFNVVIFDNWRDMFFVNMLLMGLFAGMFLEMSHPLLLYPQFLAEKSEKWLILADNELSFVEKNWMRIFVTFNEHFSVENFLKSDLEWLEFRSWPSRHTFGGFCMNPSVIAEGMDWEISVKTKSAPKTPEPRRVEDPLFHLCSVKIGDISFESAAALHKLIDDWLPPDVPLRALQTPASLEAENDAESAQSTSSPD